MYIHIYIYEPNILSPCPTYLQANGQEHRSHRSRFWMSLVEVTLRKPLIHTMVIVPSQNFAQVATSVGKCVQALRSWGNPVFKRMLCGLGFRHGPHLGNGPFLEN